MERLTLSVREAGEALGLSGKTVRNLISEGRLPAVKVGQGRNGHLLIPKQALMDFLSGKAVA